MELHDLHCICVTAILIALDLALKWLTQYLPSGKISIAFLAIAAIGMLFGPVVAFLAGGITDILGMLIITQNIGAFNPLFLLVEMTGGLIYGLFLYDFTVIKPDFSGGKAFFKSIGSNWGSFLRIVLAKFTVIVICNLLMNTSFQVLTGYIAPEAFMARLWVRVGTNFVKMPVDILLMLLTLYPIKKAYEIVFGYFRKIKNS